MFACWLGLIKIVNLVKNIAGCVLAGAVFLPDVDVVRPGSDLPSSGSGSAFIAGARPQLTCVLATSA